MLRGRKENLHRPGILRKRGKTHQTLGELLEKRGQLELLESKYYIKQIIEAVGYCHKFKIVHRDIKPDNIIISSAMQIKLIDFGLSNSIHRVKKVGFYVNFEIRRLA